MCNLYNLPTQEEDLELKESDTRFSSSDFHESVSTGPLSITLGPLRIFTKIRRDIRNFVFVAGVTDNPAISYLPVINLYFRISPQIFEEIRKGLEETDS